jgi:hypothetical protein
MSKSLGLDAPDGADPAVAISHSLILYDKAAPIDFSIVCAARLR